MRLSKNNKNLTLKCRYEERWFPKELRGRWDNKYKLWTFPLSVMIFNAINELVEEKDIRIEVDDSVENYFKEKISELNSFKLTGEFKTKPYAHQEEISSLIIQKKRFFVFAGVGTGKSKAAIDAVTVLHREGEVKRVLVVSPASIMWNFANEISTHSFLDSTVIFGTLNLRKILIKESSTVFDIINYEMVEKLSDEIISKNYDMVIFDEIHYCKSRTSNRSKACEKISKDIPIRVGLTGTIISNSYEDLFMPYKIIDNTIFGTYFTKFKERYFILHAFTGFQKIIGYCNEDEIKKLISLNSIKFDIRDVIKNLPDEQNITKSISLNPKTSGIYKQMKNNMLVAHERGEIVASNVLERMLRLSQVSSGFLVDKENDSIDVIGDEKISALRDLLTEIKEKTVIFCRFRHSIDRVSQLCDEMGISAYIYDGRTKDKELYLKYNSDDTQIWIAQLQKSEGYSIPSAQYCIFYELDYSRKNHIQSRGRILRATGADHDCIFYIYLLAKKTIDEAVYKTLQEKDFNSEKALAFVKGVEQ